MGISSSRIGGTLPPFPPEGMQAGSPEANMNAFYHREGLRPPYIPEALKENVIEIASNQWGTDRNRSLGDPIAWATEALTNKDMPDTLALGYHNKRMYYCIKQGPLVFLMEYTWGGHSQNNPDTINGLSTVFKLTENALKKAREGEVDPNKRLILLDSDVHHLEKGYKVVDTTALDPNSTWSHDILDPSTKKDLAIGGLPMNILELLK